MTLNELVGIVAVVGSAWLGGALGARTLAQANAAPLARPVASVRPSTSVSATTHR